MESQLLNEYKTKDLGEAAALICQEAKLIRLEEEKNFYWFVFIDREFCQRLSNSYWFGKLLINAKTYQDALRTLKDRLFARR